MAHDSLSVEPTEAARHSERNSGATNWRGTVGSRAYAESNARTSGSWLEDRSSLGSAPSFNLSTLLPFSRQRARAADVELREGSEGSLKVEKTETDTDITSDHSMSIQFWARSIKASEAGDTVWKGTAGATDESSQYPFDEDASWLPKSSWQRLDKRWRRTIYSISILILMAALAVLITLLVKRLGASSESSPGQPLESTTNSTASASAVVITKTSALPAGTVIVLGSQTLTGAAAASALSNALSLAASMPTSAVTAAIDAQVKIAT